MFSGIGGWLFKILFEISAWLLRSPSTVKGDAPVRSSYVSTPTLHQSTLKSWPVLPPRTTSGAMYSIVPQNEYVRWSFS
uniref:Putative secreted protein n=1 Tax=Ixodes ricinus TaxID=34613 RepID=A0A6B0U5Q4_IXORI